MRLEKLVAPFVLAAGLYFGSATAGEPVQEPKVEVKEEEPKKNLLFQKEKQPKFNLELRLDYESKRKGADYNTSYTQVDQWDGSIFRDSNIPNLSAVRQTQVEDVFKDIKNGNINSYKELVQRTKNFSDKQKLVLLSGVGDILGDYTYENKAKHKVYSQDRFFNTLQYTLQTGNHRDLHNCRGIHSHIERLAKILNMKSSTVSGVDGEGDGHIYSIVRTRDGLALIDYDDIVLTETKNVKKALEAYQKERGTVELRQFFWKGDDFKYSLINDDGREFLNFLGYDETSTSMKKELLYDPDKAHTRAILQHGSYSTSAELSWQGLFAKMGEIRGASSSPLKDAQILQLGFARQIKLDDIATLDGGASIIYGNLDQDLDIEDSDELFGIKADVLVTPSDPGRLSGVLKASTIYLYRGSFDNRTDECLIFDSSIGAGLSYKFETEKLDIKPYTVVQFSFYPEDIGPEKYKPLFSEFGFGTLLSIKTIEDAELSFEPYCLIRPWEDEAGLKSKFGKKNFGANAEVFRSNSDYWACPDKEGFNLGAYTVIKGWELNLNYEKQVHDYDGEEENINRFGLKIGKKF